MLALNSDRVVGTGQLIDGVYGTAPPDGVVNALQAQVSRLRRGLRAAGVAAPIEMSGAGYRLAVDPERVDVHRFARLARDGRRSLDAGEPTHAAALLHEAVRLWQGAALADLAEAPFAAAQAARMAEQRLAALEDLAEAELKLGRYAAVVARLQEAAAEHPLRERLRGQLMRALAGAGRQAEALAEFEDARRVLAEELGTDPSAELTQAHLAVLRGEVRPAPERASALSGLPARVSGFVGRRTELAQVDQLLAARRLVTLVGPGGVGKTRLALELAERAVQRTVAEARFVNLAVVDAGGTGGGVAEAVAGALDLHGVGRLKDGDRARPDPIGRLLTALDEREALLILDNCEHVVDEAAVVVQRLLEGCRQVRVLVTSREALGITGEMLWPLAPLETPAGGEADELSAQEALGFAAVRLFTDRAAAVQPAFRLGEAELGPVLRICARLDGLPLALELAAARLRSLPLAEVEARLDDRFRLLERGERTAAPRHRTLRAVVEWSWDLLADQERALARRLAVFVGGAPLSAVVEVCACDDLDDPADALVRLVDKSLVEVDAVGRYRMLQTVRDFCAERLAESGEQARVEAAHARWCLRLAAEAEPHLRGSRQLEWLRLLDAEHPNLLAALRRSLPAAPRRALRLAGLLSGYWFLRGLRGEVAPLAEEILRAAGRQVPDGLADEYVLCVLNAHGQGGDTPERSAWWRQAMTVMDGRTEPPRYPYLTFLWAMTAGPTEASRRRPHTQVGTDPWSQALRRIGSGYAALRTGGPQDAAEREFQAALRGFRTLGDRIGAAKALDAAAMLAARRGRHGEALELWAEGIAAARELDAMPAAVTMRCNRGAALLRTGDLNGARAEFAWAESVARRNGLREELGAARCGLGEAARLEGDLTAARRLFEMALYDAVPEHASATGTRMRALMGLGRVAEAEQDVEAAQARHREALEVALRAGDLGAAADAVEGLAGAALLAGDGERAAFVLGLSDAVRGAEPAAQAGAARTAAGVRDLIGALRFAEVRQRGASRTAEAALAELGTSSATVSPL
ncbi:BTAD domain-containing putative transcriptional regulator [Actinomadura sp. 21ATH]|uniref:BTAD domain-containing putative transcriptional regulator n=1 Tax=Actinomadura sp. 21ATH TaxID=1735444 RepID=UPI0035BF359C